MHREIYSQRYHKLDRTHHNPMENKHICFKKLAKCTKLNDNDMYRVLASAAVGFVGGISLKCLIDKAIY